MSGVFGGVPQIQGRSSANAGIGGGGGFVPQWYDVQDVAGGDSLGFTTDVSIASSQIALPAGTCTKLRWYLNTAWFGALDLKMALWDNAENLLGQSAAIAITNNPSSWFEAPL